MSTRKVVCNESGIEWEEKRPEDPVLTELAKTLAENEQLFEKIKIATEALGIIAMAYATPNGKLAQEALARIRGEK